MAEESEPSPSLDGLSPFQTEVWNRIRSYGKAPLDAQHVRITGDSSTGKTVVFVVEARSADEYEVGAYVETDGYTLGAGGWHDQFNQQTEPAVAAQRLVEQLAGTLYGKVRLLVKYAGKWPYSWQVIPPEEDETDWGMQVTGLFFYNYFGRRRIEIKQNSWP